MTIFRGTLLTACIIAGVVITHGAGSAGGASDPNIREACRSAVAGLYLQIFDELQRDRGMVRSLDVKIPELQKELKKSESRWQVAKQKVDTSDYDPKLSAEETATRSRFEAVRSVLREQEGVRESAAKLAEDRTVQEKELRMRIEKVFTITQKPQPLPDIYQFDVEYRSPCPKYRFVCPLPREHAKALREIFAGRQLPTACERYANVI